MSIYPRCMCSVCLILLLKSLCVPILEGWQDKVQAPTYDPSIVITPPRPGVKVNSYASHQLAYLSLARGRDGKTDRGTDGRMNKQMDRQVDGQTDEQEGE